MALLLHGRYLAANATQAWDLATGDLVPIDSIGDGSAPHEPAWPALIEVLDHGRDGEPRCVVAEMRSGTGSRAAIQRIAAAAADRGYVPIGVEIYARALPLVADEIRDRTLMLIARAADSPAARRVLLDAASRSSRPHVLLTVRCGRNGTAAYVSEARPRYAAAVRPRPAAPPPADVVQQLQRAARASEFVTAGRHAAAERLLRDVAAALGRRSAWTHAAGISIALGRLLLERGRPLDAVRAFTEASGAAASAGDDRLADEARIWLATARTDAAQLTAAEAICRALLQTGGLDAAFAAWTQAVLTRVLLWQGRTHDALALGPDAAGRGDGLDAETVAFIQSTAVRLLLAAGRLFEAGLRAPQASPDGNQSPVAHAMLLTSRLRVLAAAGDMAGAESCLHHIAAAARAARAPLRLLRARLVWIDALRRAGRTGEAERLRRMVARMARAAPPLLRQAVEQTAESRPPAAAARVAEPRVSAASLVHTAQEEDEDETAVKRLMAEAARHLRATRVDFWSADAGPATVVQSVGTGLPSTIGGRVIDAGIAIGPDGTDPPLQFGFPVRVGTRLVGALVARWPADRTPSPDAHGVLELVAAVAAPRIDALLHRARLASEAATLIPELVGVSRAIGDVRQAVARAAAAPFAVLVEGESGVGKELIARAVHYLSPRRERRFCDVNCAALPDELLESELFGHARGAFTGAVADRPGLFEDAHGGTIFLDEVADLSPRAQAKLLRVLQQQEIRRVGETFVRPVDVRLVTAANRDMRAEAATGRFRQDLLYRIDVIRINVPALRDRPEDIAVLAQHFWRTAADRVGTLASLSPAVLAALAAYHWPGNVRELQNVIAAFAVASPRRGLVPADLLPRAIVGAMPIRTARLADARDQFERRFVEVALAQAGGNRARAARALGLSRQGLLKLMGRLRVAEK